LTLADLEQRLAELNNVLDPPLSPGHVGPAEATS
jgi:hypothetical protein